jgi:hypothetical protein
MTKPSPAADTTAVMTPEEVAAWLHIEKRQLERYRIPCLCLGHKTRRYLKSDVLEWLAKQRKAG